LSCQIIDPYIVKCTALLIVIVANVLATKIRSSTVIEGIQIAPGEGKRYIKICQLADDTAF